MNVETKIVSVDQINPDTDVIRKAASVIRGLGTVVFPTETVYGLGANAYSEEACEKIFSAKDRPKDNPLIVHISSFSQLKDVAVEIPDSVTEIMKTLWPGPITVLLKKSVKIPSVVTAGLDTVAVRIPGNPLALSLIEESGVPIAAPSANIATRPSIVDSKDAVRDLSGKVDMILDAGRTFFGIESTIINVMSDPVELLRPGAFEVEELEKYFGKIKITDTARGLREAEIAITPGLKYRHYSPEKKLFVAENDDVFFEVLSSDISQDVLPICSTELSEKITGNKIVLGSTRNLYEIASNLFISFRSLDESGRKYGLIQRCEERGIGLAIMNRIRKASTAYVRGSEDINQYV